MRYLSGFGCIPVVKDTTSSIKKLCHMVVNGVEGGAVVATMVVETK